MTNKGVRRIVLITLCAVALSACKATQDTTQDNNTVRWPDFLRDWAADYKLNSSARLDLINIIDTVYQFLENSTASMEDYCESICRMKDGIKKAIVHDEELEFRCMMRATALNYWGYALKDKRFFECGCSGKVIESFTVWYTLVTDTADFMSFVFIPVSWLAPAYYAELVLIKFDNTEEPLVGLNVVNKEDFVMDRIQLQFCDSAEIVTAEFNEDELLVDSTNVNSGRKIILLPFEEVMKDLLNSKEMILTFYNALGDKIEIFGLPHASFTKQVGDCPRLQSVMKKQSFLIGK